jgi:methylase of polypeptide subunit release factors
MTSLTFANGLMIEWGRGDDGGGSTQYTDFLAAIPPGMHYARCLEWCSGLSAIGFSLLDAGIIDELVLMDVYKPALDKALDNAYKNGFTKKVRAYHCNQIGLLPTEEKFDLVVGNPPHTPMYTVNESDKNDNVERITVDYDWKIHSEFFANIHKHLNHNSEILLSEITVVPQHIEMAKQGKLRFDGIISAPKLREQSNDCAVIMKYYYEEKIH